MDEYLFIGLLMLVFIGIPVGVGLLLYFIPKRLGYPKASTYLIIGYGLIVLAITFFIVFEDQLFTENNAKRLIEEQGMELIDEFELVNNKSMSAIGDYYHTFTLEISERDKNNAVNKIKNSDNFQAENNSVEEVLYMSDKRYFGPKVIQNYETVAFSDFVL